jgi:hypothetical protein
VNAAVIPVVSGLPICNHNTLLLRTGDIMRSIVLAFALLLPSAVLAADAVEIDAGTHTCEQIARTISDSKAVFVRMGFGGRSFRYPPARWADLRPRLCLRLRSGIDLQQAHRLALGQSTDGANPERGHAPSSGFINHNCRNCSYSLEIVRKFVTKPARLKSR